MKKIIWFGGVLAMLLSSMSLFAGERHTESEGGFSYEVPANWRVMEFPSLKFKVIVTDPINDFSPNMTLVDERFNGSLSEYEKASIPHMKKAIPGFSIIKQTQQKTLAGRPFRTIMYLHKAEIGEIIQTASFLELGEGHKLVMTCTSPKGYEDKIEPVCNKVVQSLQVN